MSDRGRKYQTYDNLTKTKTEINREYYFKYIRNKIDKGEPVMGDIDEDLFFELSVEEVKDYFFGKDIIM